MENKLSASKIKTAQSCSWKYWCSYHLKLPQKGNDGSSRGWICHLIFELLGSKKHHHHYKKIIKSGSIFSSKSITKLVHYHAKKLNVFDQENLDLMDMMTVKGLLYDFFGASSTKPSLAISEQDFDLEIQEDGKNYRIRGFIDKLFLYDKKTRAVIRDFKTSKQLFKGKELTDNLQNLMYCLAVKKMFPTVKDIEVEFLFLKFDLSEDLFKKKGSGVIKMDPLSKEELEGFEYQLDYIQEYLNDFDENHAVSNFAGSQDYPSDKTFGGPLMCGREGFKKSRGEYVLNSAGEKIPNYICEFRLPMEYYALLDKEGNHIKSLFDKESFSIPDGFSLEKRHYEGCPYFKSRNLV